jgi:hypothetical protein
LAFDEPRAIDVTLRYEMNVSRSALPLPAISTAAILAADAVGYDARPAGERDGCLRRGDA